MKDYMTLGPTPTEEECQQIGSGYDRVQDRLDQMAYKDQLERMFPEGKFIIKSFPHDFGSYSEVCLVYDDEDGEQMKLMLKVEANLPMNWDEIAKGKRIKSE